MRELLFRGQTRRYGEKTKNLAGDPMPSNWVYGGIFHQNNRGGDFSIIYSYDPIEKYTVYADTVGQYTGLTDKNGVKIFEGDFIRYRNMIFTIEWQEKNGRFLGIEKSRYRPDGQNYICYVGEELITSEVIGNIYDNPKLLKNQKEV